MDYFIQRSVSRIMSEAYSEIEKIVEKLKSENGEQLQEVKDKISNELDNDAEDIDWSAIESFAEDAVSLQTGDLAINQLERILEDLSRNI